MCVAVCCSMLHWVSVCYTALQCAYRGFWGVAVRCKVLRCITVRCSAASEAGKVLKCVAVCRSVCSLSFYGKESERVREFIFVYIYITYTYMHTHTRTHTPSRVLSCSLSSSLSLAHTHAHKHTHTYTHTHTHTFSLSCSLFCSRALTFSLSLLHTAAGFGESAWILWVHMCI